MPLHLTYRPNNLEEFYGNDSLKESLQSILHRNDKFRAYLLTGPSGCGKTTLARIIAKEYGCDMEHDYHELNISQIGGKDESGRIQQEMLLMPRLGDIKTYCLDECQSASEAFKSGILKALEDTPKHVLFIICTTDPERLKIRGKPTIHTRCAQYEVHPLPGPVMSDFLLSVIKREFGEEYTNIPDDVIQELVNVSEGCPRQALVILDQVIDIPDYTMMIDAIKRTKIGEVSLKDLMDKLIGKAPWNKVAEIIKTMDQAGEEWESLRRGVRTWCTNLMLNKGSEQAAKISHHFQEPLFNDPKDGFVLYCWKCLL
jgi:DNA polymerase III subunit gamma/tau